MPTDPQPDLDPAEADLIRIKAHVLARRGLIPRGDVADARQDLAVALLAARAQYDPAHAGAVAFAETVTRRAAIKIARSRLAAKRHAGRVVRLAAPAELADPADNPTERAAVVADVATVVATLPPDLRDVAEALTAGTVAAAAQALGVSRATVYHRVREIRSRFARAGLGGA